jgi:uncharacterized SAM-binding protein YcdF (DUF218 family)
MLGFALILFALAALGGLTMAGLKFSGKAIPLPLAIGHGLLAATALILLIREVMTVGGSGLLTAAVVIFVLAALGGLTLFSFHLRGRELPKPLILAHGGIAATGFIVLVFAFLAQ